MPTINLERGEWLALRNWIDEHGYSQQRDEPIDAWRDRTEPIAYAYALIVEAGCDHVRSESEPYCSRCSMLMEDE